jgi:DNA-directed RNA polymerase subunit RPC12/RpoP
MNHASIENAYNMNSHDIYEKCETKKDTKKDTRKHRTKCKYCGSKDLYPLMNMVNSPLGCLKCGKSFSCFLE